MEPRQRPEEANDLVRLAWHFSNQEECPGTPTGFASAAEISDSQLISQPPFPVFRRSQLRLQALVKKAEANGLKAQVFVVLPIEAGGADPGGSGNGVAASQWDIPASPLASPYGVGKPTSPYGQGGWSPFTPGGGSRARLIGSADDRVPRTPRTPRTPAANGSLAMLLQRQPLTAGDSAADLESSSTAMGSAPSHHGGSPPHSPSDTGRVMRIIFFLALALAALAVTQIATVAWLAMRGNPPGPSPVSSATGASPSSASSSPPSAGSTSLFVAWPPPAPPAPPLPIMRADASSSAPPSPTDGPTGTIRYYYFAAEDTVGF